MLAECLQRLQEFEGAIEALKRALEFKPKDVKILVHLARLYRTVHVYEAETASVAALAERRGPS